jgi:hypothetical protein
MRKNSNIICDSYLNLTAVSSHYQDNWICDETWFRLLNAHYPHLKNTFNFTREGLNRALSAKAGSFTGPNEFGLFLAKFQTECPYSGERRRVSYFYRQVNGKLPADPVSPLDITDELSKSNLLQRGCMRLGIGGGDAPLDGNTPERGGGGDGTTQDSDRTPKRARKANNTNDDSAPTIVITPGRAVDGDDAVTADVGATGLPLSWDSPEAAKLFGFSYNNGDDVYGRLKDRIHLLSEVQRSEDGYKRFVIDIEKKPLSTKQIFLFRKKCMYLRTAYIIALEKLGYDKHTWVKTCCKEAVEMLAYLGLDLTLDPKRVSEWNRLLRRNGKFRHPNNYVANGIKQPKPKIFALFPQAVAIVNEFVLSRLDHVTSEMLRRELIAKIIPALEEEAAKEKVPEEYDYISGVKMFLTRGAHNRLDSQVQPESKKLHADV